MRTRAELEAQRKEAERELGPDIEYARTNRARLQRRYAGEYAVIKDRRVIHHGRSLAEALREIERRGLTRSRVVLEWYLPPDTDLIV